MQNTSYTSTEVNTSDKMSLNITFLEFGKLFAYKTGGDITNLENILKERGAADATVDNVINALRKDGVTMEEMYEKYGTKDVDVLMGDLSSVRDKIILALKGEGYLTITGIFNWIVDCPLLIDVSKRTLSRELDAMVDTGLVRKDDFDYFWGGKEVSRSVVIGSRPISSKMIPGNLHLGIKIGNNHPIKGVGTWTEVMSKHDNDSMMVLDSGSPALPVGFPAEGVASSTDTPPDTFLGYTSKTDAEINLFRRKWCRNHPKYNVFTCNCRHYVFALTEFLNTPPPQTLISLVTSYLTE